MSRSTWLGLLLSSSMLSGTAAATDAWEAAPDSTAAGTEVLLVPDAPPQTHDLQGSDSDWYVIAPRVRRSYEVLLSNAAAMVSVTGNYLTLDRRNAAGDISLTAATFFPGSNKNASIRWISAADAIERILVLGASSSNTADSLYTIQLRETTAFCPRWNNAATQASVLIVQNAHGEGATCNAEAYFYNETGALLHTDVFTLAPNALHVAATAALPGLPGQKGSAAIAHTCGLGGLKAKLVALEPATGFSFDTPCTARDR